MAHDGINENIQPQKEQPQKETLDIIEKRLNIKEHKNTEGLFIKPDGGDDFTKDTLLNIASENPETKTIQIAETPKNDKLFIQKKLNPNLPNVEIGDFSEEEERNAILFRQAFKKKCELVTTPVFDKFKLQVENKRKMIDINKNVDFNQSFFELRKDDKMMRLTVNYPGFSKVDIITEIFFGNEKKGYNAFSLNLTEYSFHKLSITLEGLIQEYETYI